MERHVLMKLRTANKDDFADQLGNRKNNVLFFHENKDGVIERKANYLNDDTDMKTFKQLYANNQVFVPVGFEVAVLEESN